MPLTGNCSEEFMEVCFSSAGNHGSILLIQRALSYLSEEGGWSLVSRIMCYKVPGAKKSGGFGVVGFFCIVRHDEF